MGLLLLAKDKDLSFFPFQNSCTKNTQAFYFFICHFSYLIVSNFFRLLRTLKSKYGSLPCFRSNQITLIITRTTHGEIHRSCLEFHLINQRHLLHSYGLILRHCMCKKSLFLGCNQLQILRAVCNLCLHLFP